MKIMMVGSLSLVFLLAGTVVQADTIHEKVLGTSPAFDPLQTLSISFGGFPHFYNRVDTAGFTDLAVGDKFFLSKNDPGVREILEFSFDTPQELQQHMEHPMTNSPGDTFDFPLFTNSPADYKPGSDAVESIDFQLGCLCGEHINVTQDLIGLAVTNTKDLPQRGTRVDGFFINVLPDLKPGSRDVRAQFGYFSDVPELGTGPSLLIAAGLLALAGWGRRKQGAT